MYSSLNFILVPPRLGPTKRAHDSLVVRPQCLRARLRRRTRSELSATFGRRLAAPQLGAGKADRDGEVDVLAAAGHEDADDVALLVERGAARVARVRGGVGLDRAAGYA